MLFVTHNAVFFLLSIAPTRNIHTFHIRNIFKFVGRFGKVCHHMVCVFVCVCVYPFLFFINLNCMLKAKYVIHTIQYIVCIRGEKNIYSIFRTVQNIHIHSWYCWRWHKNLLIESWCTMRTFLATLVRSRTLECPL